MTKRNDIHRDSKFQPADYDYVFSYATPGGLGDPGFNGYLLAACMTGQPQQEPVYELRGGYPVQVGTRTVQPIEKLVGRFFTQRRAQCDVCGAHYRYGDVWQHRQTGEAITIGHECADKYGALVDRRDLAAYRKRQAEIRKLGRDRVARREALRLFVREASPELRRALRADHHITQDIRGKLIRNAAKYGANLSDRQQALVLKLAGEAERRAQQQAERDAEQKGTVVEGRQAIRGEVVSVKWQDNDFGGRLVMTVKVDTPAGVVRLWGTVPSALADQGRELRGQQVEFTATVQKSDRDEAFGFFKRPSKARALASA